MKTLIIIPSRLSATRLPGKPLLKINGLSIVSHVFNKATKANIGDVYVATEDQEIIDDVTHNGGQAILTGNQHKTGTDRIYEALTKIGKVDIDLIMNLQGDEPMMSVDDIRNLHTQMLKNKSSIGTMATKIRDKLLFAKQNVVKVVTEKSLDISNFPKAKKFVRNHAKQETNVYQHLGIYCYTFQSLKKFVGLNQSPNEVKNKLEQLRALDNNIDINVCLAKQPSIGIDTKEDFVAIKKIMEYKS